MAGAATGRQAVRLAREDPMLNRGVGFTAPTVGDAMWQPGYPGQVS